MLNKIRLNCQGQDCVDLLQSVIELQLTAMF